MQDSEGQSEQPASAGSEINASPGEVVGVFARGLLMGLAELVPGVSGGTIAFISGVYYRLISALSSFGRGSVVMLGSPKHFWRHHQLNFLTVLALGMAAGILLFAQVIGYMLVSAAPVLWAFFFGVIFVSVYQIGAALSYRHLLIFGGLGLLLGLGFLSLPPQDFSGSMVALFFAGMVAVCAWILPGISGSFVLLLLGLYTDVITAVNTQDWFFLFVLGTGCASGLLLFTRVLGWLLNRFHEALLALLTGFMATALLKLWPWQASTISASDSSHGLFSLLLLPQQYASQGQQDFLLLAVVAGILGGMGIWLLSKFAPR